MNSSLARGVVYAAVFASGGCNADSKATGVSSSDAQREKANNRAEGLNVSDAALPSSAADPFVRDAASGAVDAGADAASSAPAKAVDTSALDAAIAAARPGALCSPAGSSEQVSCRTLIRDVVIGGEHTCALSATGAVRCWGYSRSGQLGYGNTTLIGDTETPASAGDVGVGHLVTALSAGSSFSCALLITGALRCWGFAGNGELGHANRDKIGDDELPASAGDIDIGGRVVHLASGAAHTCALLESGAVRCWGFGGYGQLGYGNTENIGDDETPASVGDVDVGGTVVQLTAGHFHTCALLDTGAVRCWGEPVYGQLGYPREDMIGDDETPASAGDIELGGLATQVVGGGNHTCALLETGRVRCWGKGTRGQLGYGNEDHVGVLISPAEAGDIDLGGVAVQIAAAVDSTCALLESGAVRCWGSGAGGRQGHASYEDIGDNELPASAGDIELGGRVRLLASGHYHNCAVLETGALRCWGLGHSGRLGYANIDSVGNDETPAEAGDVSVF